MFGFTKTFYLTLAFLFANEIEAFFGSHADYLVYWNVPTFMCHKYGMKFEEVSRDYRMIQNPQDEFRGSEIAMLYDPGLFPALLQSPNGSVIKRNGGVPQEGSLDEHLKKFKTDVALHIPDESFHGLAIIDFESWRPIYRQNWASLAQYKVVSEEIMKKKHPNWNEKTRKKEAAKAFEKWGKKFMEETLNTAKTLRPKATWGYYAFPYCFNLTPNQPGSQCDPKVLEENDSMAWLFKNENVILPSVYLRSNMSRRDVIGLIRGRIKEAMRMAEKSKPRTKVLAYTWYKYHDKRDTFVTQEDLQSGIREIIDRGADGYVIWGSSSDLKTKEMCQQFRNYLNEVLGPAVLESKETAKQRVAAHGEESPYQTLSIQEENNSSEHENRTTPSPTAILL
ncbi:hyaluronidase-like isoform X2 [Venturia canescens]|uniref:hyaluronidase-like isoform X2 n=1 Tax=Venturia canescens TaxID=32260 RepID=UPI001C9BF6C5|nr:hyaluronidase-like isoform X2 [Venturia canescens]